MYQFTIIDDVLATATARTAAIKWREAVRIFVIYAGKHNVSRPARFEFRGMEAKHGGSDLSTSGELDRPVTSLMKPVEKKLEDKDDEKIIEKMLRKVVKDLKEQLDGCSVDEKIRVLEKRFFEKQRDFNKLERANARLQGLHDNLQSDMDNISQELSKIKSTKAKLDALCKQLQKQNKDILDECQQAALEDKERKREQQERFATMIQVITSSFIMMTESALY
jgi:chromosome segregation ATPase